MYVCRYVGIYVRMHACMCMCICLYTHIHTCIPAYIHTHVSVHVYAYVCGRIYVDNNMTYMYVTYIILLKQCLGLIKAGVGRVSTKGLRLLGFGGCSGVCEFRA